MVNGLEGVNLGSKDCTVIPDMNGQLDYLLDSINMQSADLIF